MAAILPGLVAVLANDNVRRRNRYVVLPKRLAEALQAAVSSAHVGPRYMSYVAAANLNEMFGC
jgi:hypothetical protein